MTATTNRVLLIEDNEPLGRQVVATLGDARYETRWVRRGDDALAVDFHRYHLVILDLRLPGASGFEVLAYLRHQGVKIPVVIISVCWHARDRRCALGLGASDYVAKPFWPGELLERVAAQLRPQNPHPESDVIDIGDLTIDLARRRAWIRGVETSFTTGEFAVLAALARRRGAAVSRGSLLLEISEVEPDASPAVVDVYVSWVKDRMFGAGVRIRAVWGVGYRLDPC